jgi:hypothetical protein
MSKGRIASPGSTVSFANKIYFIIVRGRISQFFEPEVTFSKCVSEGGGAWPVLSEGVKKTGLFRVVGVYYVCTQQIDLDKSTSSLTSSVVDAGRQR